MGNGQRRPHASGTTSHHTSVICVYCAIMRLLALLWRRGGRKKRAKATPQMAFVRLLAQDRAGYTRHDDGSRRHSTADMRPSRLIGKVSRRK
jgi:hypothetical protein